MLTSTSNVKPDFRFIHMADTHLGLNWPAIGRRDKIQIPVYGKAFSAIVDAAIRQQVDFVVHAGDLVDRPRPSTAAWSRLLQELPRLKEAGIPFIITVGSHDKPDSYFDRAGGDILQLLESRLGLVKRVDTDQNPFFNIETKSGKEVTIYGLGDHGREQEEHLQTLCNKMNAENDFSILMMHGSVSAISPVIGPTVRAEVISQLLSKRYVDYVALGHNHKRWEHRDLHVYNPGSPEYTSFADAPTISYLIDGTILKEESRESVEHGYYLVEVTGEIIEAQFNTLESRDVKNIRVGFAGATPSQVIEGARTAITQNISDSSIIRPILSGTLHPSTSRSEIDVREILSLREKVLFLDYPLIDLDDSQVKLEAAQVSDIHQLLRLYFESKLGHNAKEIANIAGKLVELYAVKGKKTVEEAMTIIDGWRPDDKKA